MKLEISHLTKSFAADAPVLSDISFSAETSSLALIGSSGGGKSTLLRIIGGLISAETGTVTVNGRTLGRLPAGVAASVLSFSREASLNT